MGIFKRKKDEDVKIQLEREALDKLNIQDDDGYTLPLEITPNDSIWNISGKTKAPHTITAEELNNHAKNGKSVEEPLSGSGVETDKISMTSEQQSNSSPSEFLFQKMVESRNKNTYTSISNESSTKSVRPDSVEPSTEEKQNSKKSEPLDIEAEIRALKESAHLVAHSSDNSTVDDSATDNSAASENVQPIETELISMEKNDDFETTDATVHAEEKSPVLPNISEKITSAEERRTSLLARCNAFLEDDEFGIAKIDTDKYKLESVESILESFEARAAQRVNKKFSSSTYTPKSNPIKEEKAKTVDTVSTTPPPLSVSKEDTTQTPEKSSTISSKDQKPVTKTTNTTVSFELPKEEVKHLFIADIPKESKSSSEDKEDLSTTKIIADISSHSTPQNKIEHEEKTIVIPAVDDNTKDNDTAPIVSAKTEDPESSVEKIEDYKSISDRNRVLGDLIRKKRIFNIKTVLSFILLIPAILLLTPMSGYVAQDNASNLYIIDLVIIFLGIILNLQILKPITNFFKGNSTVDIPVILSLITTFVYSIVNIFTKGDFIGVSAISIITLFSYNLSKRGFYSSVIKNFNLIATPEFKSAVSIINNKNITKNVVGNAIDGSALVCYGGETTNIHGFLSYSYCQNPVASKIKKISMLSLIFGAIVLFLSLILTSSDFSSAFYYFTVAVSLGAIPSVYHIVSLPINAANKRLRLYDAMLTGYRAADELEFCNGIAVSSEDLFPEGSIRLVDIKLLSPNPFDQSMLDAASIASAIHSPIAGIFNQVNTAVTYKTSTPEVDSVIYEEKMGISGWVNDRRVFVGNRDLMVAHGFSGLPPAELDKKIMRKGYFPVYIASDNIPCALLIVRYEPDGDIAYELQRLSNTGTTILVHNCDPNISAKMLCDYFKLYDETVALTTKQGSDNYCSLTEHREHRKAGAAFKSSVSGLFATLTASINIKKYVSILFTLYVCSFVLGFLGLIVCLFTTLNTFTAPLAVILFQIVTSAITLIGPVIRKP